MGETFFAPDIRQRFIRFCRDDGNYNDDDGIVDVLEHLSRIKCFKEVAPEGGIRSMEDLRHLGDPNPHSYRLVPKEMKNLW